MKIVLKFLSRLQFVRALLLYKSKKYASALCFVRSAIKFSPSSPQVLNVFASYLSVLSDREDLAARHVFNFFEQRERYKGSLENSSLSPAEIAWVTAFAQYLLLGSIESGSTDAALLQILDPIKFQDISIVNVGSLYRKMFPLEHLQDVESAHRRYGLCMGG